MTYHTMVQFAHTWGMFLFVIPFTIAVIYALWPANREEFRKAARAPLESGDE
jgi:cytochrome c oxidase cbb3-type subunit 4